MADFTARKHPQITATISSNGIQRFMALPPSVLWESEKQKKPYILPAHFAVITSGKAKGLIM
jgi:hypothetical protein